MFQDLWAGELNIVFGSGLLSGVVKGDDFVDGESLETMIRKWVMGCVIRMMDDIVPLAVHIVKSSSCMTMSRTSSYLIFEVE